MVAGEKAARTPRFVKTSNGGTTRRDLAGRARRLVGLKGYVTNIAADLMPAGEVIASYHDLWQVEQSFRMSKTDLRARPMFHHTRDAIEAHLTIVFAALAVARDPEQDRPGDPKRRPTTPAAALSAPSPSTAPETFPPESPPSSRRSSKRSATGTEALSE